MLKFKETFYRYLDSSKYRAVTELLFFPKPINAHGGQKIPENLDKMYVAGKSIARKIIGEMLIKSLPTTLLQIFHRIILKSQVTVRSI